MNDGGPRNLESRSELRAADGPRWRQFSLASAFVVVTVTALVLSVFFSVGRLLGMSNMEVLTQGLGQFLYALPTLLVWIVGLRMAIRRRKRNWVPAILTMIALGGLILAGLVLRVVNMAMTHSVISNGINYEWAYNLAVIAYVILEAACWILILLAIFAGRPADARETETVDPDGDPSG